MNEAMQEKIREIKQSFRQLMDGQTAQSMRDKGLEYKLNWGASIPMPGFFLSQEPIPFTK